MDIDIIAGRIEKLEAAISANATNTKDVLTFDEACAYTGLSASTLYKLTSTRRIPHYKPTGRIIYFDREELKAWLLQNRISTSEEIDAQAMAYVLSTKTPRVKHS